MAFRDDDELRRWLAEAYGAGPQGASEEFGEQPYLRDLPQKVTPKKRTPPPEPPKRDWVQTLANVVLPAVVGGGVGMLFAPAGAAAAAAAAGKGAAMGGAMGATGEALEPTLEEPRPFDTRGQLRDAMGDKDFLPLPARDTSAQAQPRARSRWSKAGEEMTRGITTGATRAALGELFREEPETQPRPAGQPSALVQRSPAPPKRRMASAPPPTRMFQSPATAPTTPAMQAGMTWAQAQRMGIRRDDWERSQGVGALGTFNSQAFGGRQYA